MADYLKDVNASGTLSVADKAVVNTTLAKAIAPPATSSARKDAARFLRQATFGAPREAIDALVAQGYEAWLDEQFAKPAEVAPRHAQGGPQPGTAPHARRCGPLWKQYFEGPGPAAPARRLRAVADLRRVAGQQQRVNAAYCGMRRLVSTCSIAGLRQRPRPAPRRHPESRHGRVPQHEGQRQGRPGAADAARRELRAGGDAAVLRRPADAERRRHGPSSTATASRCRPTTRPSSRASPGRCRAGPTRGRTRRSPGAGSNRPTCHTVPPGSRKRSARRGRSRWSRGSRPSTRRTRCVSSGPAHDTGAKQLIVYPGAPYSTLPAGQSPRTDLENVIDNLFFHPNVGPFLGKQLIQRLVTSNPSPQYVAAGGAQVQRQRQRRARRHEGGGPGDPARRRSTQPGRRGAADVRQAHRAGGPLHPVSSGVHARTSRRSTTTWHPNSSATRPARPGSDVGALGVQFLPPEFTCRPGRRGRGRLVGPEFEITDAASISRVRRVCGI